jgi:hypothetical protein
MNGDQEGRAGKLVGVLSGLSCARPSWRVMHGVRRDCDAHNTTSQNTICSVHDVQIWKYLRFLLDIPYYLSLLRFSILYWQKCF